ncbi:MAG: hypothetical protein IPN76_03805 [Saprospiraceae bacterium]|nr:hypothetical protein [Saprospiraceae bacterium]
MKNIIAIIGFVALAISLSAQPTPDDMAATFFADFKRDKSLAVHNIYQTSPWMARASDAISNMKGEVEKLTPEYVGEYYGFSLICSKQIADCFVLQSYLLRFGRQPIRFTFEFYKPDKNGRFFPCNSM